MKSLIKKNWFLLFMDFRQLLYKLWLIKKKKIFNKHYFLLLKLLTRILIIKQLDWQSLKILLMTLSLSFHIYATKKFRQRKHHYLYFLKITKTNLISVMSNLRSLMLKIKILKNSKVSQGIFLVQNWKDFILIMISSIMMINQI